MFLQHVTDQLNYFNSIRKNEVTYVVKLCQGLEIELPMVLGWRNALHGILI